MESSKSKAFRSLLGVLSFMAKYPWPIAICISLLLVNIAIEMTLPQIIGTAVTNLRWHIEWGAQFDSKNYVLLLLALVFIRTGVGHILGPVRNKIVHNTLNDLREAVYDAMQRFSFSYHDRTNSGELISRATTDVWRLQEFFFACLLMVVDIAVSLA